MEKESIFMQMHKGERVLYQLMQKEYDKADDTKRKKLAKFFPEFFGEAAAESGIFIETENASFYYKGWFCVWDEWYQKYYLYTPSKEKIPLAHREFVFSCETPAACREYING